MHFVFYKCGGCGRVLRKKACVLHDDPMAPFGPELLCPHCESIVSYRCHPVVIVGAVVIAVAGGLCIGWLTS